jgi:hypothetical protein
MNKFGNFTVPFYSYSISICLVGYTNEYKIGIPLALYIRPPFLKFFLKKKKKQGFSPPLCLSFPCLHMLLSQHYDNVNKTHDCQYLIEWVNELHDKPDYACPSTNYDIALVF